MLLLVNTAAVKTFTFPSQGHTISVQLSKNGGAYANPSAGPTNLTDVGGGIYSINLSAIDTNALGTLTYSLVDGGIQVAPLIGDVEDQVTQSLPKPKDLITLARAAQNVSGNYIGNGAQVSLLSALITAVSSAIEKYCRRDFTSKTYDELYNGNGDRRLLLRQYPIQSVQSVRYRPVTVLKVTNNTTANVQARVSVTNAGLTLFRMNAGTSTTNNLTFAGNVTLTAMATAINALGNGWNAQVTGDATNYGSWPSSDLYWPTSFGDGLSSQGALSCVAGSFAELKMHTYEMQGFQWDARGHLLRAIPYTDPELMHPEDLAWPMGINNLRVQYTAGYTTVPEDIQEACAEWVAQMYYMATRDPALQSQLAAGTASAWSIPTNTGIPLSVKNLLDPHRRYTIGTNQG